MNRCFTYCLALLMAALLACPAQAQTPPLPTPRQALDTHFANLDKTQVPTGFLAEYGVPLAPLHFFNGTLTDSSLTSPEVWRLAYATAYTARVGTAPNPLPTLPAFNARVEAREAAGPAIPLLLARLDYATVRPDGNC